MSRGRSREQILESTYVEGLTAAYVGDHVTSRCWSLTEVTLKLNVTIKFMTRFFLHFCFFKELFRSHVYYLHKKVFQNNAILFS